MHSKWTTVALTTVLGVSAVGVGAGAAAALIDMPEVRAAAPAVDPAVPDASAAVGKLGALGSVLKTVNGLVSAATAEKPDADALEDKLTVLDVQTKALLDLLGGAAPSLPASPPAVLPDKPLPVSPPPIIPLAPNVDPAAHALPLPGLSLEDALANLKKDAAALVAAATKVPPNVDGVKSAVTSVATDLLAVATAAVTKLTGV
ncbi:hypothetical protein [Yinghuangia seranimata]|uniref:hypothetical protein n=1 Tax=Yinghuangia seranimata TaxID=408067 RepID=UPI00248B4763|nr:hypothetical protein [Yinghuangia seranimata]MDI2130008.1 hypothetical protein [Yinghuangia seranimata]